MATNVRDFALAKFFGKKKEAEAPAKKPAKAVKKAAAKK